MNAQRLSFVAAMIATALFETGCMSKATQIGSGGCPTLTRSANMLRAGLTDDCGTTGTTGIGSSIGFGTSTGTGTDTSTGTSTGTDTGTDTSTGLATDNGVSQGGFGVAGNPFAPGGSLAGLDPNHFFASLLSKFGDLTKVPDSIWAALKQYLNGGGTAGGNGGGGGGVLARESALVVSAGGMDNDGDPVPQLGGGPHVKFYLLDNQQGNLNPTEAASFYAYDAQFRGGVRSAVGDVDGDGLVDIVTVPGPGGGPHVKVFNAAGQEQCGFWGLDPNFRGGLYVAVADVDNDLNNGKAEIIIGAGYGGGPAIFIWRVSPANGSCNQQLMSAFWAFDPNFRGGVRVAAGDINNDGFADVIAGAGYGGGPAIKAFSGAKITSGDSGDSTLLGSIIAFNAPDFRGGVYVGATDYDGDGYADIVAGAGRGGGPIVAIYSGKTASPLIAKYAYDEPFRGGVRVGGGLATDDELYLDYVTSPGPGGGPHVRAWHGGDDHLLLNFFAFDPQFTGGIYANFAIIEGH